MKTITRSVQELGTCRDPAMRHPISSTSPRACSGELINLCFHGIGTPGRVLESDEAQYWVGPAQFDELLCVVRRHPAFRITFDDSNASDVSHALPGLLRHELTASFFVVAARLDRPGSLTSADVRQLAEAGMTVGSHGMHHRHWRFLDDDELRAELGDAARIIAAAAGQPVREVACPFGDYDRRVLRAIQRHGFSRVYTVDETPARSETWEQARFTIRSHHTGRHLEQLARSPRGAALSYAVRSCKLFVKHLR